VNYSAIVIAVRVIQLTGIPLGSNIAALALAGVAVCCGLMFHFFVDQPLQQELRTQQWFGFRIGAALKPRAKMLVGPDYRPVRIRSTSCFTVGMKPFE
jgi:peptidoglycan/LPS O-acetylase OafA/YrhL